MKLKEYRAKRKFNKTTEPSGKKRSKSKGELHFVVQKHQASHLHYDFRLEMDGVLKSWAVPKGPSLNPNDKRLAMMVEDHPIEYGNFEGIIPPGNYGAGTVMVWDEGVYYISGFEGGKLNEEELLKSLKNGNLKFFLEGKKLKGEFALVRMKREPGNEWLLIKKNDKYASDESIIEKNKSVLTGRTLEEIKLQSDSGNSVWYSGKINNIEIPDGAKRSRFPHDVRPMMCTLVDEAFDSDDWIFEIKWDGFRAIAEVDYQNVLLYSRNLLSFNQAFSMIPNGLSALGIKAVLDGEIVVLDEEGKSDFQSIQNYKSTGKGILRYYVFDILYYNGYDLTKVKLIDRKEFLQKILPDNPVIKYSAHIKGEGIKFFEAAKEKKLEGIIAKESNSTYDKGIRAKNWLKIKIQCEQEAVICGFTEPRGGRKKFGALVLGLYDDGELKYIGHSGTGFNDKVLHDVFKKINPLITNKSPFREAPKTNSPVTWVKPKLVCNVKFQEWTGDGIMRVPVFMGLREDKDPKEVKWEIEKKLNKVVKNEKTKRSTKAQGKIQKSGAEDEASEKKTRKPRSGPRDRTPLKTKSKKQKAKSPLSKSNDSIPERNDVQIQLEGRTLKFTNLHKIYWPNEGYTKGDLIEYYNQISDYILPYLKDRPENLRRNPDGVGQPSFFHKDMIDVLPEWIPSVKIFSETNDKDINYMLCQSKAALLFMANLGCIEINPWLSRLQSLDYPDYFVIDLDPHEIEFDFVVETAQAVKEILDRGEMQGFCKTSGSKGLHIYVPLGAKYNYEQVKNIAHLVASLTHKLVPEITSLERSPGKRKNKVYLDYLQNRMGQTLAAPYCVRPVQGATVSTPLLWKEVKKGLHPSRFTFKNIFDRLKKTGDIFTDIMGKGIDMEKSLDKFQS